MSLSLKKRMHALKSFSYKRGKQNLFMNAVLHWYKTRMLFL